MQMRGTSAPGRFQARFVLRRLLRREVFSQAGRKFWKADVSSRSRLLDMSVAEMPPETLIMYKATGYKAMPSLPLELWIMVDP